MPSLYIQAGDYTRLQNHLLQGEDEEAAFGLMRSDGDLHLESLSFIQRDGFAFQSSYHIELRQEEIGKAIKQAWDAGLALVEFHSHPSQSGFYKGRLERACFSPSDIDGFTEWVPHVMWRLKCKQPYLAIVIAPESFDALLWLPEDDVMKPRPLISIILDDGTTLKPTGDTLALVERGAYEQQRAV
jgi:hypothetical protein